MTCFKRIVIYFSYCFASLYPHERNHLFHKRRSQAKLNKRKGKTHWKKRKCNDCKCKRRMQHTKCYWSNIPESTWTVQLRLEVDSLMHCLHSTKWIVPPSIIIMCAMWLMLWIRIDFKKSKACLPLVLAYVFSSYRLLPNYQTAATKNHCNNNNNHNNHLFV